MVGEGADECDGRGKKIRERGREGQDRIKRGYLLSAKFLFLFVWGARADETTRAAGLLLLLSFSCEYQQHSFVIVGWTVQAKQSRGHVISMERAHINILGYYIH